MASTGWLLMIAGVEQADARADLPQLNDLVGVVGDHDLLLDAQLLAVRFSVVRAQERRIGSLRP